MGRFSDSLAHARECVALYDRQWHSAFAQGNADPGVGALSESIYCLWFLGYPDQALERAEAALALARELDHPVSLQFAAAFAVRLYRWHRERERVQELAGVELSLWADYGIGLGQAEGELQTGWREITSC